MPPLQAASIACFDDGGFCSAGGPSRLAQRAKLPSAIIQRAESADGEPPITLYQAALIRNALERFGVEFTYGDSPGVRLSAKGRL
jgi:hypothetical protein